MQGDVLLKIEYRPGGEFVEGGVSNVQHHGHVGITPDGRLDLKTFLRLGSKCSKRLD